jgi:hypothetical protein
MDKGFQQDVGPWLETLLGYIFFASGNRNLSQDLIKQRKQSPSVLKQNVNGLETHLRFVLAGYGEIVRQS